jgi:ABC-type glutathione transport system ATPase component
MVLEKGEIRDFGDTGAVLAAPKSPHTQGLLTAYRAQDRSTAPEAPPQNLEGVG